jgi:hypothetical protein
MTLIKPDQKIEREGYKKSKEHIKLGKPEKKREEIRCRQYSRR